MARSIFLTPYKADKLHEASLRILEQTGVKLDHEEALDLYLSAGAKKDPEGRILLPQYLKDFAGIKRDVIVVGVSNRIEIWSRDTWKEFYANSKQSFEEIAERLIQP